MASSISKMWLAIPWSKLMRICFEASRFSPSVTLEAFPFCLPDEKQKIAVEVNGSLLLEHQWADCEPSLHTFTIPAQVVKQGWNEVKFRYAYAAKPAEVSQGQNSDYRALAVGVLRAQIDRVD